MLLRDLSRIVSEKNPSVTWHCMCTQRVCLLSKRARWRCRGGESLLVGLRTRIKHSTGLSFVWFISPLPPYQTRIGYLQNGSNFFNEIVALKECSACACALRDQETQSITTAVVHHQKKGESLTSFFFFCFSLFTIASFLLIPNQQVKTVHAELCISYETT